MARILFLALIVLIGCLFLLFTLDFFKPVAKRAPSSIAASSMVRKYKLIQKEGDRNTDFQGSSGQITDLYRMTIYPSTYREEKYPNLKYTTKIKVLPKIAGGVTKYSKSMGGVTNYLESAGGVTNYPKSAGGVTKLGSSNEITHIEFLKVHKAASSTVESIILRFGLKRNLSIAIPTPDNYVSREKYFFSDLWPPLPKRRNEQQKVNFDKEHNDNKYDILGNHMVFNDKKVSQLLHNDSSYVAIVREPYDLFLSAANYYRYVWHLPYLDRLSNETFITDLIRNPRQYEASTMSGSMTYNTMAYDFGLEFHTVKGAENISDETFKEFLKETANTFNLVLVVERFDESLVLLRRYLNWSFEDILYTKINTLSSIIENTNFGNVSITANDMKLFKRRNKFDYSLYQFFKDRLAKQISKEEHFADEVTHFKATLLDVQKFCNVEKLRPGNITSMLEAEANISSETNGAKSDDTKTSVNETAVAKLIKLMIITKKLSKRQKTELLQLENLLKDGSFKLKLETLSDILHMIFPNKGSQTTTNSKLLVPKSKWNEEFYVTSKDCELIAMDIVSLYSMVKQRYIDLLIQRKFGYDFSVIETVKYISTFF